jgi:hypothetical protein
MLSEVNDLFGEIVDEGTVGWSNNPVIGVVKTKKLFGGYEESERIVSDYTPAKVYVRIPQPSDNSTQTPAMIHLRFNYIYGKRAYDYDGRSQDIHSYNQVTIAALNNEIFLAGRERPANKSENKNKYLLELIVKSIKNPDQVCGHGIYKESALSNPWNTLYQTK